MILLHLYESSLLLFSHIFSFFSQKYRWATDKLLIKGRDFIPTALLPCGTPIFKKREDLRSWKLVSLPLIPGKMTEHTILGTTSKCTKDKTQIYGGEIPLTLPASPVWQEDLLGEGSPTDTVFVDFSKAPGIVSDILWDKERKSSLDKWTVQ